MSLFSPTAQKRRLFFMSSDIIISFLTLFLAYNLRFNFEVPVEFWDSFLYIFFSLTILKIVFFLYFNGYMLVWRFFTIYDVKIILKVHLLSYFIFSIIFVLFKDDFSPFARAILIIDGTLSILLIGFLRSFKRLIYKTIKEEHFKSTLLIGVTNQTQTIIQNAFKNEIDYYPQAIISLEKNSHINSYIQNIKISHIDKLEEVIKEKEIKAVIFTQKLEPEILKEITTKLNNLGIYEIKKVKLLSSNRQKFKDISIEDLLARNPKDLNKEAIKEFIKEKTILITGAGGSIGSEISRQCKNFKAKKLILVDNGEFNLYKIGEELPKAILKLNSVTDKDSMQTIFKEEKIDLVIHTSAYKHVPLCEANPQMAIFNNIIGTKNIIDLSIENRVKKVVIISTDKAVRPTNIMGATKRVTELYASNINSKETEISAVRFGNVLGSSGSVIPKFKAQIEENKPITVTHPDITRYFMLISEACQLVLQTATIAKGGEIFVLDMGEPIKIVNLAKQMINLYGKENKIVFTGLRAGEKLYEELLLDESEKKTKYNSIFIAKATKYNIEKLNQDIEELLKTKNKKEILKRIVKEYNPNSIETKEIK